MTPAAIAAIKDRASTFTDCPLYWPNETIIQPSPPSPYVWCEIKMLGEPEIRSMGVPGSHWLRDNGFLRFYIVTPSGQGTDATYSIGSNLAGIFRIANFGGLQTLAPSTPTDGIVDGDWYTAGMNCNFWFDYQG
jgi:hypothetical protein